MCFVSSKHTRNKVGLDYLLYKHQDYDEYMLVKKIRPILVLASAQPFTSGTMAHFNLLMKPKVNSVLDGSPMTKSVFATDLLSGISDIVKFSLRKCGSYTEAEVIYASANIQCQIGRGESAQQFHRQRKDGGLDDMARAPPCAASRGVNVRRLARCF